MEPVTSVTGIAAPLLRDNVDTDTIAPGQRRSQVGKPRALTHTPQQLAEILFSAWRYDDNDEENPDFVLNRQPWRSAGLLITGDNFGCGSSRETAVEALYHFGIRAVIGVSFGEIFFNNCFKWGVVPVIVPREEAEALAAQAGSVPGGIFEVDVERQVLTTPGGRTLSFVLPELRRQQLLLGLDEIGMTMQMADDIQAFQERQAAAKPWVFRLRSEA